jgi:hypothetical protein
MARGKGKGKSKNVTVTVPEELSEKMEKWKDAFNYSRIFQEAVSEAIQRKEDFQKRIKEDPDMEQIIERLKEEKTESEKGMSAKVKELGSEWAKCIHYDVLRFIVKNPESSKPVQIVMNEPDSPHMEWLKEELTRYRYRIDDLDENFWVTFTEGVQEFWDEIKDKL